MDDQVVSGPFEPPRGGSNEVFGGESRCSARRRTARRRGEGERVDAEEDGIKYG